MSERVPVEPWIGRVACRLRGFALSAWARLPERPRIWIEGKGARVSRAATDRAGAAGACVAYLWLIWEAISPALSRRNGVVAAARRRLWEEVRANPAARPYLRARWAPWWLGPVRRYPVHAGLLAILLAFVAAALATGAETAAALLCAGTELGACRDGLRGLAWVILAAQVTLLALLFPLVATLVPPLLGVRVATSARVQLLLAHTEIEAAGVSAVALAILGTIGLAVADRVPAACAIASGGVLAAWFALNLAGTVWFVARALGLLTPAGREAATLAYAANEAWPAEAAPRLADAARRAQMTFWQSRDSREGEEVSVDLAAPARLVEVRLEVLQAVEAAIRRRSGAPPPTIEFAAASEIRIDGRSDGTVTLAKASVALKRIERWLIRRAHVFSAGVSAPKRLIGERLLGEMAADALDDLRSGNWPVFAERIGTLAALHGLLLRISSGREADGARRSLAAQLPATWFTTVAQEWAETSVSLFQDAARRLPETFPAFRYLARLPERIGTEAGRAVPPDALAATDMLLAHLAYRLYDRGAEAAGRASEVGDIARTPMPLPDAARDWYDEAWRYLSAAWEGLTSARSPRPPADAPAVRRWAECVEHWPALERHLRSTTDLVAKGALLGDAIGGGRALDLLLRWPSRLLGYWGRSPTASGLDLRFVSPALLANSDWAAARCALPHQVPGDDRPVDPLAVFHAAISNAWADEHVALAAVLIAWAMEAGADSPAAELLRRHIHRQSHDTTAGCDDQPEDDPFDITRVLRAIADATIKEEWRPNLSWDRFRRIRDLRDTAMVPGRVYGSSFSGTTSERLAAEISPLLVVLALRTPAQPWPKRPEELGLASPSLAFDGLAGFFTKVAAAVGAVSDDLLRRLAPSGTATDQDLRRARKVVLVRCRLIACALRRRLP
jgi:hypothetical protein